MLDEIHIRDLVVQGIIGVNPQERVTPQDILVNATLHVDTRKAGANDAVADVVNYSTVTKAMVAHMRDGRPKLVEHLVASLARVCFETDDRIEEVTLTVEKPGAVTHTRSVGVTIHRVRAEVMGA